VGGVGGLGWGGVAVREGFAGECEGWGLGGCEGRLGACDRGV